jgi:glycerophosphoryl diester phosphodiesterase
MARLIGPDEASRTVFLTTGSNKGKAAAQGMSVPLYADVALTQAADVRSTTDQVIAGTPPTLTVDAYSQIPLFKYPDGVDVVYTSINGGPPIALYARTDERLDGLGDRLSAIEAGGAGDQLLVHRSGAETIAGVKTFSDSPIVPTPTTATQTANKAYADGLVDDLSGVTNASAARASLGLGNSATKNVGTTAADVAAGDAALRKVRVSDLPSPFVLNHKGGANVAPEDTMDAYRASVAYGQRTIDVDAVILADGAVGVMHDSTIDRTTTGTGAVADQTSLSWKNLVVDSPSWFGGNSFGNTKPPLLTEVFAEFGGKVVIAIEPKTQGACAVAVADLVNRFGLKDSVILFTAFWADIPTLVATGAHVRFIMTTGTEKTPAEIAAAGVAGVDCDYTAAAMTSTLIGQMHAAGLTVYGYTMNRQSEVAAWMAKGGDGWISDDPYYSAGFYNNYAYRLSKMPLTSQTYYHGHITGSANVRGVYTAPDGWGVSDTLNLGARTILIGAISPIKGNPAADTFTIDFTIKFESAVDTNRWTGLYVCFGSDQAFSDSASAAGRNGYRCLISGAGNVQIAKYTDGVSVGNVASATSTALSYPATVTGKIVVTPTQISLQRTDVAATATATDSTYRGGYVWAGFSGVTSRFTRLEVTA